MKKSVLTLGAGMVSRPLVKYLLDENYTVTVADLDEAQARRAAGENGVAVRLNIDETARVKELIAAADLTVSLLPPKLHPKVAELCLEVGRPLVTASYLSPEMQALDEAVKAKGLVFVNELGLDPGLDHMLAMEIIDDLKEDGWRILSFDSHCGGLPSRKAAVNPLRYKLSWSPAGVLNAITRPAKYLRGGKVIDVSGDNKLRHNDVVHLPGLGVFESNPNADSPYYGQRYGLTNIQSVRRGTLRYPGWAQFWLWILGMGFLDKEKKATFQGEQALSALFRLSGENGGQPPEDLFAYVCGKAEAHASVFLEILESLGLLDPETRVSGEVSCFDIMLDCALKRLQYEPGEADWVILHHEFVAEKDGRREKRCVTLSREGEPGGVSAMAFLVGVSAAIAAKLVLEDRIDERGVVIPLSKAFYLPILSELSHMGISHQLRTVELPPA